MAEVEWAILCDYAFKDAGGKTCLIGIFDRIFAGQVPGVHRQASLVLKFTGEPDEKLAIKITVTRPTGDAIGEMEGQGELASNGEADIALVFVDLPIPDWGAYLFNVHVNGRLAKSVGFNVLRPPLQGTVQ